MKYTLYILLLVLTLSVSGNTRFIPEDNFMNYWYYLDYYPTLEGEENGRLNVTEIMKKETIKAGVANDNGISVHSFEIQMYNGPTLVNIHKYTGSTAPNIFKKYRYDKENPDVEGGLKLVTHFIFKVSVYDAGRVVVLSPRLIYFYME